MNALSHRDLKPPIGRWLGLCLGLLVVACSDNHNAAPVLGTLERQRLDLVATAAEPVIEITVQEGDSVNAGTLLAQLDDRRQRALVAQASAEVELAWQQLLESEHGPRSEAINQARSEMEAARARHAQAQKDLRRTAELVQRKVQSQAVLDQAQAQFETTAAELQALNARLDEMLAGTRNEQIAQARAQWEAARARLEQHEITLQRLSIYAPVDGIVDTIPTRVGEQPNAGATVMTLLDNHGVFARVYVPVERRQTLTAGSAAQITLRGSSETDESNATTVPGRVRWISAQAAFTPFFALNRQERGNLVYLAEVDVVMDGVSGDGDPNSSGEGYGYGSGHPNLATGLPVSVTFPVSPTTRQ